MHVHQIDHAPIHGTAGPPFSNTVDFIKESLLSKGKQALRLMRLARFTLYHFELYYIDQNFLFTMGAVERKVDEIGFFSDFRSGLASAYRTMYPP